MALKGTGQSGEGRAPAVESSNSSSDSVTEVNSAFENDSVATDSSRGHEGILQIQEQRSDDKKNRHEALNEAGRDLFKAGKNIGPIKIGDDNYFFDVESLQEGYQEKSGQVLTVPLEWPPEPLEAHKDSCNEGLRRLNEHHLLILSCFDERLLNATGRWIADRFEGQKRTLFRGKADVEARMTMDELLRHSHLSSSTEVAEGESEAEPPPTLIVVFAPYDGASGFLDSILKSQAYVGFYSQLRKRNYSLLVLADSRLLSEFESIRQNRDEILLSIPFLEFHLTKHFPGRQDEIAVEIERQRSLGLWGGTPAEFWEHFSRALDQGLEEELQLLREREAKGKVQGHVGTIQIPEICPKLELDTWVVFLAAFFPQLPYEDFDRLLTRLLGDRQRDHDSAEFDVDDEGIVRMCRKSLLLRNEWADEYDEVQERCQLAIFPGFGKTPRDIGFVNASRGPVVDFARPAVRDAVQQQFLRRHYPLFVRLCQRIRGERLLFDSNLNVSQGMIHLMEVMAAVDPSRYGAVLLMELREDEPDRETSGNHVDRALLLQRLYILVRSFLRREELRSVVKHFFTGLIDQGRSRDVLYLVKRLRNAPEFDPANWWKQLLDRGQEDAKELTMREMHSLLSHGGSQVPSMLRRIAGWQSASGIERSSVSAKMASDLFATLLQEMLERSQERTNNVWPPEDSLLLGLCPIDVSLSPIEPTVIGWIFHESFCKILESRRKEVAHFLVRHWILGRECKNFLDKEKYDELGSDFYERLQSLPRALSISKDSPSKTVEFQAVILADLAMNLSSLQLNDALGAEVIPLVEVARAVNRVCDGPTLRALASFWSDVRSMLSETLSALISPEPGALEMSRVEARLREQILGAQKIKKLVSEAKVANSNT